MIPFKVAIIGCGSWGSAISRIVGHNVKTYPDCFEEQVPMWVFEEVIDGCKLSEMINSKHENAKYLPGKLLPPNVVAVPDLVQTVTDAKILIYAMPHQFVEKTCGEIAGHLVKDAIAISLTKGLGSAPDGSGRLISEEIKKYLGGNVELAVLMGANIANEVASDQFCEATIGTENEQVGYLLKRLFDTENFRITVVKDAQTVEVCGALKNVVACAAGFCDGLDYSTTTKSSIIRIGLIEMIAFIKHFFKHTQLPTFLESCGVADLIATCYGGRNRRCAAVVAKTGKTLEEVERELLDGQKLQGPATAAQAFKMIQKAKLEYEFPLFVAVHQICTQQIPANRLLDAVRDHPVHL